MELEQVVPWGRSYDEYLLMFQLTAADLNKRILGCSDGPASFNAELSRQHGQIVSVDPVYQFNAEQLRCRIDEVYPQVILQLEQNQQNYIWQHIHDVAHLAQLRMDAMSAFLSDYKQGFKQGRYIAAALPRLPFSDNSFDLALCSHFLFLYSQHINEQQHIDAMLELCRVATEVRVYPLVSLDNTPSPHLDAVINALGQADIHTRLQPVDYQFQKGATHMLIATRSDRL